MGAATALMEAGARSKLGLSGALAFGACIVLSPPGCKWLAAIDGATHESK